MTDIVERLRNEVTLFSNLDWQEHVDLARQAAAEIERLRAACSQQNDSICQTLGKALGYPWFKDDQKIFPGATEENGVCVGDHVAESLADEICKELEHLRAQNKWLQSALRACVDGHETGRYEPAHAAYENAKNVLEDYSPAPEEKSDGAEWSD